MRKLLLILFLFFSLGTLKSQTYFNKLYNSSWTANSVVEVKDGYIILGVIDDDNFVTQTILIKTDFKGDTIWQKIIGKAPQSYIGSEIIETIDGNIVFNGKVRDSVSTLNTDIILIKINSNTGNTIWSKRYYKYGQETALSLFQTNDQGFVIAGSVDNDTLSNDYYLLKTDSAGKKLWEKSYGGSGNDLASSVIQTDDGGFMLAGYSNSYNTNYDLLVVKTDEQGNQVWDKVFDYGNDNAGRLTQLLNGDILIISSFKKQFIEPSGKIVRLTPTGNVIWDKSYLFGVETSIWLTGIENSDGSILTGGRIESAPFLLKINANGDTLWTRIYSPKNGIPHYIYNLKKTSDNGYIIAGSGIDTSAQRAWVIKIDCFGSDSLNYYFPNEAKCCGMYSANVSLIGKDVFCEGDSARINASAGYANYAWSNGLNSKDIKVTQTGNYQVTITDAQGCSISPLPISITVDTMLDPVVTKIGSVLISNYLTGNQWYKNGMKIDSATAKTYDTKGIEGDYTVKLSNSCGEFVSEPYLFTGVNEDNLKAISFNMYPNPTNGSSKLEYTIPYNKNGQLKIYDYSGRLLNNFTLDPYTSKKTIDLSGLSNGIYFYQVEMDGVAAVNKKMVVIK